MLKTGIAVASLWALTLQKIEHTDLLLTVPRRLGDVLQGRGAFRFLPVPFPLPEYVVKQHWHERYHHDEGNRWLRRLVSRLLAGAA